MFVTTLIKDNIFRQFLLERFPKPNGVREPAMAISMSDEPSKFGNTIEYWFKLILARKTKLIDIENDLKQLASHIDWFSQKEQHHFDFKNRRVVLASKLNFEKAKKEIANEYSKEHFEIIEKNKITTINVNVESAFRIGKIQSRTELPLMNCFDGNKYSIISKNNVDQTLENLKLEIPKRINKYFDTGKITNRLINDIFILSTIIDPFFKMSPNIKFNIETAFLKEIRKRLELLVEVIDQKLISSVICKPDFSWKQIRARPDFLIDDELYEIKTTKKFLSTYDYLQILTYLLLHTLNNQSNSEFVVKKAILFYPLTCMNFEITTTDIRLTKKDERKMTSMLNNFIKKGRC